MSDQINAPDTVVGLVPWGVPKQVIMEEYVRDAFGYDVPLDYKVYGFLGGSPIVMQRYAPEFDRILGKY